MWKNKDKSTGLCNILAPYVTCLCHFQLTLKYLLDVGRIIGEVW